MRVWIGAALLSGMMSASVCAQGAAPAPAAQPPIFVSTRNYMVDAAIFVVLAGGAVFAVCRSSQRV